MTSIEVRELAMAYLAGVIEQDGEPGSCSLIFVLEPEYGQKIHLSYGMLMNAIEFAQDQRIIPPLSAHWWARTGNYDGCLFQNEPR